MNTKFNVGPSKPMNIGKAMIALKKGKKVRRLWWDNDRKFIFAQVPATIPKTVVSNMQSLPKEVKDYFNQTFIEEQIDAIYYNHQIVEVKSSNRIVGYTPTIEDILVEDWVVLN